MANTPRARALTRELKSARTAAGFSARQLAHRLGWSHAKLSRVETAKQGIAEADVAAILAILGVIGDDRERLLKMTRDLDEPAWWEVHAGVSAQLAALIDAEQRSHKIIYVAPSTVPGLLQTRGYTRAIYEAAATPTGKIDDAIGIRQTRQGILERANPVELVTYLDETALSRPVGGSSVAAEQLRYLLKAGERPNITTRVLPLTLGFHTGLDGMYSIMELSRGQANVHIEARHAGVMLSEPGDVQPFQDAVSNLSKVALGVEDSAALIEQYAMHHEEAR